MKISFLGLEFNPGKIKYKDQRLQELTEKFSPKKVTPFFVELIAEDFISGDSIAISKEKILDLLILDIEKIESRLSRASNQEEKVLLKKCQDYLEKEIPLSDVDFSPGEKKMLKELSPLSLKPVVVVEDTQIDVNLLLEKVFSKAKIVFFYTAGKKEVRSWPVKKDSDIVTCAGKIHSDLARGFIKADILSFADFKDVHNMNDAKSRGLTKNVGRDYIIKDGDIVEIRFNV